MFLTIRSNTVTSIKHVTQPDFMPKHNNKTLIDSVLWQFTIKSAHDLTFLHSAPATQISIY